MSTESVVFRINAQDFATPLMAKVAQRSVSMRQGFHDAAGAAKGAGVAIAGLGNALGVAPFGQFASGLAGSIGALRNLSIQMNAASKSAMLLKVGMGAIAFTIGYQVGSAVSELIQNTTRMREEFDATRESAKSMGDEILAAQQKRFARENQKLELLSGEEQEKARAEQLARINNELGGVSASLQRGKEALHEYNTSWNRTFNKAEIDILKDRVAEDQARLKVLREQRSEVSWQMSAEKKNLETIKESAEARKQVKSILEALNDEMLTQSQGEHAAELRKLATAGATAEDIAQAKALIAKTAALKAEKEAQKQSAEEEKKRQKLAEDQTKKNQDYINDLKAQVIEIGKGKIAADEFKAKIAGISDEAIQAGSEMRRLIEESNKKKEEKIQQAKTPDLAAVESRLMSRGRVIDPVSQVVDVSKKQLEQTKRQTELMQKANDLLDRINGNTRTQFEEIHL